MAENCVPVHRAREMSGARVYIAPLCAPHARPMRLGDETWTWRDNAVTCAECLALIAARGGAR